MDVATRVLASVDASRTADDDWTLYIPTCSGVVFGCDAFFEPCFIHVMIRTTAFERTAQAAQVRRSKAALLPVARAEADRVSLQVHVALDAMRRNRGNLDAARTLCQVMLVTGLLIEAGYGDATFEQLKEAESILFAAFNRGRHFDLWMLEEEEFQHFAIIVATYDYQMRRAPLAAIIEAGHRLERFRAGESFDQMAYRRT